MWKYYRNIIILLLIACVLYWKFDVSFMANNEFNLITANTVLVGFLFTILTILMSFLNEDIIETYKENNELSKIFGNITMGIVWGTVSIFFIIAGLCILGKVNSETLTDANRICFSIEISLFILVMKSILMAMLDINCIIGAIWDNKKNKKNRKKANEDMKTRFGK